MRCPRCNAVGQEPCLTPSGRFAARRHKDRPTVVVGEIERLTRKSVDDATWILSTDAAKVEVVMSLAREADQAITARAETVRSETAPLFDVGTSPDDGIDGTFVYLVVSLGLLLDSLGLSPKGRRDLDIESDQNDTDDLARILALHSSK